MGLETLSSLYPKATKSKNEVERLLEKFELGLDRSIALQQRLSAILNDFCRQVTEIKSLLQNLKASGGIDKSQEKIWDRRVDNLVLDSDSLRESISKQLDHIYKTKIQEEEKKKSISGNNNNNMIGSLIKERTIWQESHTAVDHALEQARNIVSNLRNQNKMLKSIRRRALDMASRMGVSHTLLYTIERRNLLDQALVYACIFLTSIIFIGSYTFVHYVYKK
ncbi:golgi transport SNARE BOS1 secretory pathway transmembrane or GPI anchor at C-terminus [Cryptosporidium bovis]|uniref:golgi transport SNARE BOS1 secretory pathway transmembrane or GPI anchor at C-terminus n=1 Tax=Cryptosporidium bovis TaxID=310047 RepID=UPI003519E8CA|nr:golgi transport SNARE BOS1 secretory pathway transmembrane or GPI anchor at C-terminus [Cryptosporidium bovis]